MIINTKTFGEIDVEEDKIINFHNGLPGFPESKRFIILSDEAMEATHNTSDDSMFYWLQSVDEEDTAFALLNTLSVIEDYSPVIDRDELGELKKTTEEDLLVYNIVVVPDDPNNMTVNLKAPVLVDYKNKVGKQVIANNDEYHIRHHVMSEIKNKI